MSTEQKIKKIKQAMHTHQKTQRAKQQIQYYGLLKARGEAAVTRAKYLKLQQERRMKQGGRTNPMANLLGRGGSGDLSGFMVVKNKPKGNKMLRYL